MAEKKTLTRTILDETPRMKLDDTFTFGCGRELNCFTHCCRDVSIVLTPYDVLRMRKALKMDSSEFLEKYTIVTRTKDQQIPVVLLRMDEETKRCPFVTDDGCGVYGNRPWACRMYPLGVATPQNPQPEAQTFYFLLKEDLCHGHGAGREMSVRDWIQDQGIELYDMMGAGFRDLMLNPFWEKKEALPPEKVEMYYMACFDLDKFKRFVFESRFLETFIVDEGRVEVMRTDDEEFLDFAMQWLRFFLFGDKTMKIRPAVLEAKRQAMEAGQ
jgi:Fe-S-cluster containining protein